MNILVIDVGTSSMRGILFLTMEMNWWNIKKLIKPRI